MSPYRVLVMNNAGHKTIMASMLSIDKKTQERRIFILNKPIPLGSSYTDIIRVAHDMSNRKNSSIIAKYGIVSADNGRKYQVNRYMDDCAYTLDDIYYLQSQCLEAAMHDYCSRVGMEIIESI